MYQSVSLEIGDNPAYTHTPIFPGEYIPTKDKNNRKLKFTDTTLQLSLLVQKSFFHVVGLIKEILKNVFFHGFLFFFFFLDIELVTSPVCVLD